MEDLINGLMTKCGLSEEKAKSVVEFLKENAEKIPEWLNESDIGKTIKDKLPGGLGGLF